MPIYRFTVSRATVLKRNELSRFVSVIQKVKKSLINLLLLALIVRVVHAPTVTD